MFALPFLILAASMNAAAPSKLIVENCDAGEVYAFNPAECQIALINEGDKPIRISSIQAEKPGDAIDKDNVIVAPHARVYLRARINAGNGSGGNQHVFRFHSDEPGNETRSMSAFAFVLSALEQNRPTLDFGVADLAGELAEKSLEVRSHDVADFRIAAVIEKPDWLDVTIQPEGKGITGRIRKDAAWGIHADYIKLRTSSARQPQVWVTAKADVHGDVTPASNPFELGLLRLGGKHEFKIPLNARSGKDFRVGKIEVKDVAATTRLLPCEPAKSGCQIVELTVAEAQPAGTIQAHAWIDLPDFHQKLHVALFGLLVSKDVQIKTLDPEKLQSDASSSGAKATQDAAAVQDLGKSVSKAIASANRPPPPGNGPMLQWTIANGLAIHGFQIFRGDSEEGPFVLLNEHTVPSTAVTQDSENYQYRDNTAVSGKTYWYYIGIVYNDGSRQQLTGPQKVVAK